MCSPDGRRPDPPAPRHRVRGVVLIEVMVGVALGLLIVIAAIAAYAFTLSTAAAGRDAADLQQRADIAMQLIGAQVRQAGTVRMEAGGGGARLSGAFEGWAAGGVAVGGVEGGAGRPDALRVAHEPEPGELDCLGNGKTPPGHIDAEFFIRNESDNHNRPALYCGGVESPQAVVAGVDDMQLWFSVRDAAGSLRHVTADQLAADTTVEAVRVCLQLSSESSHGGTGVRDCSGAPITPQKTAGRMVRIVRGVFLVRNGAA